MFGKAPKEMTEIYCEASDALLRRIGRNVVTFQKLEACLKKLSPLPTSFIPLSAISTAAKLYAKSLKKLSLGNAVQRFNQIYYKNKSPNSSAIESNEALIAITHRLDGESPEARARFQELKTLVRERNRLLHHDLADFDFASEDACRVLSARLDDQNERLLKQIAFVGSVRETDRASLASLKSFIGSTAFSDFLDSLEKADS